MTTIWIVIANSSSAEIYSVNGRNYQKVHHIDFPEGREKGVNVLSDRPGRGFESMGGGHRHALNPEVDIKTHEQEIFAHKILEQIKKGKATNAFERLALIAPPEFLGTLRSILPDQIRKTLWKEVKKDLPAFLNEKQRVDKFWELLELPERASISG